MAEIIAPCFSCHEVTEVRPYGQGNPPELLCCPCALRANTPAVQALVKGLDEFIDPKNPTSLSIH